MHDLHNESSPDVKTLPPGAQPLGAGSGSEGAPPCNTAPANCIYGGLVQVIGQGIDSLYLSYPGSLSFDSGVELQVLKELAQSKNPISQAQAILDLDNYQFEVLGKGAGYYPYVLVNNPYRINVSSTQANKLPLAYIQISSQWLLAKGVQAVVNELNGLVALLGKVTDSAQVSRADLYVDFVSALPLDTIQIGQFVSRAKRISRHSMDRVFTGYSIGLGGDISARLYDKTAEIKQSNKEYLIPLWMAKGWNGTDTIYRLEFQIERKALSEHQAKTVPELLSKLAPLWRYASTNWLRLTIPSQTDSTQTRWPLHPVWSALSDIDWPDSLDGVSIPVRPHRVPSERSLFENGVSGITSFMAREGITDPLLAFDAFYEHAKSYHDGRTFFTLVDFDDYLKEKAALKARRFNLPYPGVKEKRDEKLADAYAREYRKRKDGE